MINASAEFDARYQQKQVFVKHIEDVSYLWNNPWSVVLNTTEAFVE